MAHAMLALVFTGNAVPTLDYECCAGGQDLAPKDRVTAIELVTLEWNGHGGRGRVVERIVGKQVKRLIGSADDSAIKQSNLL